MSLTLLTKIANQLDQRGRQSDRLASTAIDFSLEEAAVGTLSYAGSLAYLTAFTNMLDEDRYTEAVRILDTVLKTAATQSKQNPYADLYDAKRHNESSFLMKMEREVATAQEPSLETWKGGGHPLLTRYSPDYPGVALLRVSDGVYQDTLSKKVYDFKNGFVSETGVRYYGGSVANQTPSGESIRRSPMVYESQNLMSSPRNQ